MSARQKVYLCPTCNMLWLRYQLVSGQLDSTVPVLTCPQDGSEVINATNTPRGKRFLEALQRQEKENQNAGEI